MPTNTNPMIPAAELDEIRSQLDPLSYAQEYDAQFVNITGNAFAHCFDRKKHVRNMGDLKKQFPVRLSFDFNVNPMTCTASQHHPEHKWIYTRYEFRIENSNIYDMCDRIKEKLGGFTLTVTGDATGKRREGNVKENVNYYTIIKSQLGLTDEQFDVPKSNPFIKDNRVLCNSILYRHPQIFIHPECEHLVKDMELVQVLGTNNGDIEIDKKSNPKLTHLLDTWRYYINTYFKSFVKLK
jgi:phage terminase large subunit